MGITARSRKKSLESHTLEAYIFMSPWLIGIVVLGIIPIFSSLYFAFTDYNMLSSPKWIGVKNFVQMFQDAMFLRSLRVTFTYVFLGVPLSLLMALVVALALVNPFKTVGPLRAIMYLPSLLGGSVAISVLWRLLFTQDGLINQMLLVFGIHGRSWIGDPRYAIYTLVLLRMWQFGSPMLIFIAGIKQIPDTLYEAADLEGAGYFRKLVNITLPLLSPIILFNGIMGLIGAFQDFTNAYIISNGSGGPMGSTMFYSLYLYQKAFASFKMGFASAMAWVLLVIIAVFTVIVFKTSAKRVYYEN
ncbi:sugar ABC transporter permease [Spirochaetia bacterium]|nr:sugar ABC transporter permease [Spirochaetia bacterium]